MKAWLLVVEGETSEFSITIVLHLGSLCLYIFAFVTFELTRHIQNDIPWCMHFADCFVLVDKSGEGVNLKLQPLQRTLENKGFKTRHNM